jgi:filamentous hemagglutinin
VIGAQNQQQLAFQQVAQLTGQRYPGDYGSDQQRYQGLISGITDYNPTKDIPNHPYEKKIP